MGQAGRIRCGIGGRTGGTVIFHVSSHFGTTGSYLFKVLSVKRNGSVSVPEVSLEAVQIFPNPATDQLNIISTETGIEEVSVVDLTGRQVMYQNMNAGGYSVMDISGLSAGVYIVKKIKVA